MILKSQLIGVILVNIFASGFVAHSAFSGDAKDPAPSAKSILKGKEAEELVFLKMEVDALETLFNLEPTEAQLKSWLKLAEGAAAKPAPVKRAVASPEYQKTLKELKDALAKNDEQSVNSLFETLGDLEELGNIKIDDDFELTDAAIKEAPIALKALKASQIVSYLTALRTEIPDPIERILETIADGAELSGDEWTKLRDQTADEVGWLVHGFGASAAKAAAKDVSAILDRGHKLKDDALTQAMPALEQSARKVASADPTVVLKHFMEREIAQLFSNPRGTAAMKLWMEKSRK